MYLHNVSFVLATSALERILLQICNCYQPTTLTDMNSIRITLIKQSLFEKVSSTMSNHTIPFHFSKAKTSITRPSLSRLPSEDLHRTTSTRMDLVIYHVLQSLVISGSKEYHSSKPPASVTIIHGFKSTHLITTFVKCFTDIIHLNKFEKQQLSEFNHFRIKTKARLKIY